MKIDLPREIALKALYKIEKENAYSNLVLDEIIKENKNNYRAFFSRVIRRPAGLSVHNL